MPQNNCLATKRRGVSRRTVVAAILLTCFAVFGVIAILQESAEQTFKRALLAEGERKIALLQQAVTAARGDYPAAQAELCIALARAKRNDELASSFSSLNTDNIPPADLLSLATLSIRAEQWDVAESCLREVTDRPHSAQERLLLECQLYSAMERVKEWIQSATTLTELAPDNPAGWRNLASAHERRQNNMAAIAVYTKALTRPLPMADLSDMRHRLIEHCIETGDAVLARDHWKILLQQSPSDPRLEVYNARMCHMEGRPDEALESINKALQQLGTIPEALRLRGILLLELGRLEDAVKQLSEVARLTPNDEIAFFKLSEATRRLGQRDQNTDQIKLSESYLLQYQKLHAENLRRLGLMPDRTEDQAQMPR